MYGFVRQVTVHISFSRHNQLDRPAVEKTSEEWVRGNEGWLRYTARFLPRQIVSVRIFRFLKRFLLRPIHTSGHVKQLLILLCITKGFRSYMDQLSTYCIEKMR